MNAQVQDIPSPAGTGRGEAVRRAVDGACGRIAPVWPLDSMVAVNPYLGFAGQHFEAVAAYQLQVAGEYMYMDRAWFREQLDSGRITRADLEAVLADSGSGLTLADVEAEIRRESPAAAPLPLLAHALDVPNEPPYSEFVVEQIGHFCAGYYDQGQAIWHMPAMGDSLFTAWREYTAIDLSPRAAGITGIRETIESLPSDPRAAIATMLDWLGIPDALLEDYLFAALKDIGGWASWTRLKRWQAEMGGGTSDDIVDLLAMRVAWDAILFNAFEGGAVVRRWQDALERHPTRPGPEQLRSLTVDGILQRALEYHYQRRLIGQLGGPEATAEERRPAVQAAFCIDVRSEVFRRALETVDPTCETLGFAGFFGVGTEYVPLGAGQARAHLPVLLNPAYRVCEVPRGEGTDDLLERRRINLGIGKAWKQFKLSAASCFSFVESAGLFYAPKLVADSLGLTRTVPAPERAGLRASAARSLGPSLEAHCPGGEVDAAGIPPEQRAALAAFILRGMGLTEGLAPLVVLVGHGSTTVNNPQRAGLDCGACGGQTGEASARIAAALLNDPQVRAELVEEGIRVPADTHFLAALHDTTTDAVELLDTQDVPADRQAALRSLEERLARAGDLARLERMTLLDDAARDRETARRAAHERAHDWSQVRPEWGLAGNAAFIAAPRGRTRDLRLDGRAFLHEYDWRHDDGFGVLELIMSAPMVVANWINLQYYGSTVDNGRLGAGNKVLHNVVGGRVGVLEGNGGDLRIGLALQSLHDGRRWVHEPLRLSVFIQAPREAMDRVIAGNDTVRRLVENEWLYLFQIDDDGAVRRRYPDGRWQPWNPRGPAAVAAA